MKGKVKIDCDHISFGMIRMGFLAAKAFANTGISWANNGEIVFKGKCRIGANSFIVCGKQGRIEFGHDFLATTSMKVVSMCGVTFGKHVRIGWESVVMDSNFHPLYNMEKKRFGKAFGQINIGDYNWVASRCIVMHSVQTPERCIFGAGSTITYSAKCEPYCVHGGSPVHVLKRNVMRIYGQDQIKDYTLPLEEQLTVEL